MTRAPSGTEAAGAPGQEAEARPAYVTIRRYRNWAGPAGEVARRARDGLVPALRAQPGFRLHCAFESEDGAAAISLTVTDDREQAVRANALVLRWARTAAGDLLPHPPEIAAGPCAVCEARRLPPHPMDPPLYVTVRRHHGLSPEERTAPLAREHVLPLLVRSPGFRAFYSFLDRERPGQGVGVTLFDDRAQALRANECAVAVMLEKGIAPYPPQVTAGEALVLAVAEAARTEPAGAPAA
jgi:hypothetical protein